MQTADKIKSWFNIDVRTNHELLDIDRSSKTAKVLTPSSATETLSYDKLVLAMGAEPFIPPIDGIKSKHVFTLHTIPDLQKIMAYIAAFRVQKAAVVGGGFIGIEAAENLRNLGLEVSLFEFFPHVFPLVDADIAEVLQKEMRRNGVHLELNARVMKFTEPSEGQPGMVLADGVEPVQSDLVITAVGVRARSAIAKAAGLEVARTGVVVNEAMQTSDPDIYAVGDMVETYHLVAGRNMQVALAGLANRQGRMAADHICGKKAQYRGNVGTSVCKVFNQTVGLVGFSNENLRQMGFTFQYVTGQPSQHAVYYPDAVPMTIKVAFEAPSGKLLGAQIVGPKDVDKRIDVLAMAIRAGMTIEDLEHVELAYAPPYGAAKDPVNMVGFAGGNVLRGDVEVVHALDFTVGGLRLEDFLVLDVRSPEEFGRGHLRGAVNIPIGALREHMDALDKGRKLLAYCWVGYRGYLAYRVLKQNGFEVVNLDGGLKAVSEGGYGGLREI